MYSLVQGMGSRCGRAVISLGGFVSTNSRRLAAAGLALGATVAAKAQTTPVDYGAVLEDNFEIIDSIWGKVAVIMIAVALVTVGVRFFRKAR